MPCWGNGGSGLWARVRHIRDRRERAIELARLNGTKSPLTFHERKARRIAKAKEGRADATCR